MISRLFRQPTIRLASRRRRILFSAALAAVAFHCAWSWAQDADDVRAGRELATKMCSQCHAVAAPPGPSFKDIAKSDFSSPASLENFMRSTHSNVSHPGGMPNLNLTDEQTRMISAYIRSLKQQR